MGGGSGEKKKQKNTVKRGHGEGKYTVKIGRSETM